MICKNCGSEIDDAAMFCTNCGAPIEKEEFITNEDRQTVPEYETESAPIEVSSPTRAKSKKPFLIIAAVLIVLIVIGAFAISSLTATKELEDAIDTGNASLIYSVYSEAYGNNSKLKKYDKVIAQTIQEIKDDLNSHDFDEEALSDGENAAWNYCANNWGSLLVSEDGENLESCVSSENQASWDELESLYYSKLNYCRGVNDKAQDDWESAISNFSQVSSADSEYSNAQSLIGECVSDYIGSVLKTVDEKIAQNDISGGLDLLENAKSCLDENGLNSDEISAKIDETLVEYASNYAAKADAAFKEHDVDAAIGNIEVAMELQPENGDYKTKHDLYYQYLPFYLYDEDNCLKIDETGDFWGILSFDEHEEANNNEKMNHTIRWYNNNSDSSSSINAYYDLSGKYDVISGTLYLMKYDKNTSLCGWFKVYGDGKLLYESKKIKGGVLPLDFNVEITGVQNLKISFYGEGTGGFFGEGPSFGINNLTAQKEFPE